jgi:hypothetical protein
MHSMRQRIGFLLVLAGIAVPLAIVSVAFACGRLATLHLQPNPVRQGGEVSGYGRNFSSAPTASEVTLRLNSRSGRVVWSGRPLPNGTIEPRFTMPNVRAGGYTILATQTLQSGAPAAGTPARASLRVGSRRRASSSAPGAWPAAGPPPGGGSGGGSGFAIGWETGLLGALLSGALLGSGAFVLRGERRRRRPAALPS